MTCINSQFGRAADGGSDGLPKWLGLASLQLTRLTSMAYLLLCLVARLVTAVRTTTWTDRPVKPKCHAMERQTWSRHAMSESGRPQAYPLSALRDSSMQARRLSLRNQQRLAQLKSGCLSLARMVWRWL